MILSAQAALFVFICTWLVWFPVLLSTCQTRYQTDWAGIWALLFVFFQNSGDVLIDCLLMCTWPTERSVFKHFLTLSCTSFQYQIISWLMTIVLPLQEQFLQQQFWVALSHQRNYSIIQKRRDYHTNNLAVLANPLSAWRFLQISRSLSSPLSASFCPYRWTLCLTYESSRRSVVIDFVYLLCRSCQQTLCQSFPKHSQNLQAGSGHCTSNQGYSIHSVRLLLQV